MADQTDNGVLALLRKLEEKLDRVSDDLRGPPRLCHELLDAPHAIRESSVHRWRDPQRRMESAGTSSIFSPVAILATLDAAPIGRVSPLGPLGIRLAQKFAVYLKLALGNGVPAVSNDHLTSDLRRAQRLLRVDGPLPFARADLDDLELNLVVLHGCFHALR